MRKPEIDYRKANEFAAKDKSVKHSSVIIKQEQRVLTLEEAEAIVEQIKKPNSTQWSWYWKAMLTVNTYKSSLEKKQGR